MRQPIPKLISVIIPTYYRYIQIERLLNDLLSQSILPHEIIVVDQTPKKEKPLNFYDNFIRNNVKVYYHNKASLSAPRNFAAKKAKTDLLLFLDDDIIISEDFIKNHLEVFSENDVDVVNGGVSLGNSLPDNYPWDINSMDPVRFFLASPNFKWEGMSLGFTSGNGLIKKKIFLDVGGFDERLPRMVDFELGYRLFRAGAKIHYSGKPFAQHLRSEGGSRKNIKNDISIISAFYIHKKHFPGWITTQFYLKYIFGHLIERWSLKTLPKIIFRIFKFYFINKKVNNLLEDTK